MVYPFAVRLLPKMSKNHKLIRHSLGSDPGRKIFEVAFIPPQKKFLENMDHPLPSYAPQKDVKHPKLINKFLKSRHWSTIYKFQDKLSNFVQNSINPALFAWLVCHQWFHYSCTPFVQLLEARLVDRVRNSQHNV